VIPLADLTFLPKVTVATTQSPTASAELVTSTTAQQVTTEESTASMTTPIITRRDFLGLTATQEIEAALLGLVGIAAGSGIAYRLRKHR
jgi:hypothetical protein